MSLINDLNHRILIGDGAMGTILYSHGIDSCFEQLNITHPDQVLNVHKAYIHAGADVIQTNTYGANYIKLARYGLEDQVKKMNTRAVQIAREASNPDTYVLGNIGGIHGTQTLLGTKEEIKRSFREQLYCLLLEGVDGLILETYYDLDELKMVLEIAREETDLPIVANVSMHEPGVMESGVLLLDALRELEQLGANVVGVNCRLGPYHMVSSLKTVPLPEKAILAAYPNASFPEYRDGVLHYKNAPAYFEACVQDLRNQGVGLIGGCCGTTPEHIQALKAGIEGHTPLREKKVEPLPKQEVLEESTVRKKPLHQLAKERHSIIVELDAPKHLDIEEYMKGAKALKEAGVDAITLADNSLATPRISNIAIATLLKEKLGITPLVHLTCRDRNLIGLQAHLMGLHTLGINEILAITGDPTKVGDFPGATSVFDVVSFKLMELIKRCNEGISFSGKSLRQKTAFSVAGSFNPNARYLDKTVKRMEKKLDSGADYILTQPMYSKEKIAELGKATEHIQAPIYIGIMPLTSTRNAEFLHNEVPGIKLTDEVRERMQNASESREASIAESIAISKELIDTALEHFQGIYFVTPFMKYDMIVTLVEYIHKKLAEKEKEAVATSDML